MCPEIQLQTGKTIPGKIPMVLISRLALQNDACGSTHSQIISYDPSLLELYHSQLYLWLLAVSLGYEFTLIANICGSVDLGPINNLYWSQSKGFVAFQCWWL